MKSTNGSSLSFNSIMVDQHGDNNGYMILRIPANSLTPGNPLRIKVTGNQANLTSWYMTFKKAVRTGVTMKNSVTLDPVKKWNIKFIQHTHTDIGYTRSQTEILAEYLRYIDYALDNCDATDNYPENAKFRWTCEAAWSVDEYLKCRPASQIGGLMVLVPQHGRQQPPV